MECNRAIERASKQLEEMKLNKYQELLLKKLVDFSTLQNYDSEEIRKKLYILFFEWNREEVRKAAGKKDDKSYDLKNEQNGPDQQD